ncbi:MAG: DUF4272 domain-containing protein [Planctomycetota bacterium]
MFDRLRETIRRHWTARADGVVGNSNDGGPDDLTPDHDDDVPPLIPPDAQRVSRRALCLAAHTGRGLLEHASDQAATEALDRLQRWLPEAGLNEELEELERAVIMTPMGELNPQQAVNASWRSEGLAVLAWSLGRATLKPQDEQIDPDPIIGACGMFAPVEELEVMHANAQLCSPVEIEDEASRQLAVHWRLRQFTHYGNKPMNFVAFAEGVQWAQFNLEGVAILEDDLAVGGKPIAQADTAHVQMMTSIVQERHHAANWLLGWEELYSEVTTDT